MEKTINCIVKINKFELAVIIFINGIDQPPKNNKINVFKKGTPHGSKTFKPFGGHIQPISILGDKLAWKNAQKKETNNIISETTNNIKPNFKPCCTFKVCEPSNKPSLIISRHHWNATKTIERKPQ